MRIATDATAIETHAIEGARFFVFNVQAGKVMLYKIWRPKTIYYRPPQEKK